MAFSTYATLQTAIIANAMRTGDDEFEDQVPDFITGAEQIFNYGMMLSSAAEAIPPLRTSHMETRVTGTPNADGEITLPSDFLEFRHILVNSSPIGIVTEVVSPDYAEMMYGSSTSSSYPKCVTITGDTLKTYPVSTSELELLYYATIPALSDGNTSNWLLEKAPLCYLWASLIQAEMYMKSTSDESMRYAIMLKGAVAGLNEADKKTRWSSIRARPRVWATP
jgi:hypothetical protein